MFAGNRQRRSDKELLCEILQQELTKHGGHSCLDYNHQVQIIILEWHWQKISFTRSFRGPPFCSVSSTLDSILSSEKINILILIQLSAMVQAVAETTEHTPSILTRTGSFRYIFHNISTKAGSFHSFFNSTSSVLRMDILRHSISELHNRSNLFVGEVLLFSHAILIPEILKI